MPYIKKITRELYDPEINLLLDRLHDTGFPEGDVVYVLYKIVHGWWIRSSRRFSDLNHIRGSLHSTLHEFDRRIADIMEDQKIVENGDIV